MIFRRKIFLAFALVCWAICSASGAGQQETLSNFANPAAVKEVLSSKGTVANAAWWSFDENDSTLALQGAIDSGARKVVVPYMGSDNLGYFAAMAYVVVGASRTIMALGQSDSFNRIVSKPTVPNSR